MMIVTAIRMLLLLLETERLVVVKQAAMLLVEYHENRLVFVQAENGCEEQA
jgi:hypothetical protein